MNLQIELKRPSGGFVSLRCINCSTFIEQSHRIHDFNRKKKKKPHKDWMRWEATVCRCVGSDGRCCHKMAPHERQLLLSECVCASLSGCVSSNGYLSLSCVFVCDFPWYESLCVCCLCVCFCLCHLFCLVCFCVCCFCCVCLCRRKRLPTPTAVLVGTPGATWTRTHTFKKQQTTKTNKPPYMPIKKTQRQREGRRV